MFDLQQNVLEISLYDSAYEFGAFERRSQMQNLWQTFSEWSRSGQTFQTTSREREDISMRSMSSVIQLQCGLEETLCQKSHEFRIASVYHLPSEILSQRSVDEAFSVTRKGHNEEDKTTIAGMKTQIIASNVFPPQQMRIKTNKFQLNVNQTDHHFARYSEFIHQMPPVKSSSSPRLRVKHNRRSSSAFIKCYDVISMSQRVCLSIPIFLFLQRSFRSDCEMIRHNHFSYATSSLNANAYWNQYQIWIGFYWSAWLSYR